MPKLIERLLIVVASVAIAVGVIAVLSGGLLAGRDTPGITGATAGPGVAVRDQGDVHLRPGQLEPVYDSDPPTSGPHVPVAVTRDGVRLTDDQLLSVLEAGDVVLAYGSASPPPALAAVARSVAAPFSPALAASGQAIILAMRPGLAGVVALSWAHMRPASSPSDPALRTFAQFWLGRGYTGH
jgi:hypothetical protein